MTNHLHLALETDTTPLSRIVLTLHGSYAKAFNQRHERVGHLFQGRYKALLVQKTKYLIALVRYIHENPVKAGLVHEAAAYPWSSDRFYRKGGAPDWLDVRGLQQLLGADPARAAHRYRELMVSKLPESYDEVKVMGGIVKGDEAFALKVIESAPAPDRLRALTVEQIARTVDRRIGLGSDVTRSRTIPWPRARGRAMTAYVAWRYARIPLTQVAAFFLRDGTTLVRDVRRLESELERRGELREELATILQELDPVTEFSDSALTPMQRFSADPS